MIENIGFTGTREGMTYLQKIKVSYLAQKFLVVGAKKARHGVCKGSDEDFHEIVTNLGYKTIGHPGIDNRGESPTRSKVQCWLMQKELPYLVRDSIIVASSCVMLATPKGFEEERRSGTWATIRFARAQKKEHYIVYPDGTFSVHCFSGKEDILSLYGK